MTTKLRRDERETRFAILYILAKLYLKGPMTAGEILQKIYDELEKSHRRTKVSIYNQLGKLVKEGLVKETLEESEVKVTTRDDRNGVVRREREKKFVRRIKERYYHLIGISHPEYVARAFLSIWGSGKEEMDDVKKLMNTPWYLYQVEYLSGILDLIFHSDRPITQKGELYRHENYIVYEDGTVGPTRRLLKTDRESVIDYLKNDPTMEDDFGMYVRKKQIPEEKVRKQGPFSKFEFDDKTMFLMLSTFPECAYYLFYKIHEEGPIIPMGESRSDVYYNHLKKYFPEGVGVEFMNELYSKIKIENAVFTEDFKLFYILSGEYDKMVGERNEELRLRVNKKIDMAPSDLDNFLPSFEE